MFETHLDLFLLIPKVVALDIYVNLVWRFICECTMIYDHLNALIKAVAKSFGTFKNSTCKLQMPNKFSCFINLNDFLFSHLRVHTGERLFVCPHCPEKRYKQQRGKDLHMKSHHKDEVVENEVCKICGVKVYMKANMRLHMMNVHHVATSSRSE